MMYSNNAISVNEFLSTRWAGVSFFVYTHKRGFSKYDTFFILGTDKAIGVLQDRYFIQRCHA